MKGGKRLIWSVVVAGLLAGMNGPSWAQGKDKADEKPGLRGTVTRAEFGKPVPDFLLPDVKGKPVQLSKFKGKIIVLEWFSPVCPFVKKAHLKGGLKKLAGKITKKKDVVWISINSEGPAAEGYGVKLTSKVARKYRIKNPMVFDEAGVVGRAYGAKFAPELFIIDAKFNLVYQGGEDNSAKVEAGDADKKINYVVDVIEALRKGEKPPVQKTEPHG